MTAQQTIHHGGLAALFERRLVETIFRRRTHRVSRGSSLSAGSMSYTSTQPRMPLTELEEAVLISLTGCTGLTMSRPTLRRPSQRHAHHHGQAQSHHGWTHGGQPRQRTRHVVLPDQRHRHLLPA
jgi:hypothetical protein